MNLSLREPGRWARWGWIVEAVAHRHGVSVDELLGKSRIQPVAVARRDLYTCLWGSGLALAEVGRMVGRDHTSVLAGVRKELDELGVTP